MSRILKRKVDEEPENVSESGEESSYYDSDSSDSVPEVTLNILERQPRITAGMNMNNIEATVHFLTGRRTKPVSGQEAEVDQTFWGSQQHRTWEESESDSEVSYKLDEDDESESDDEIDDNDELDEEESEDEDEDEDEETVRKRKRSIKAYKDPRTSAAAPKRKTIIRRKPKVPDTPDSTKVDSEHASAAITRRETRDTTKARTLEVINRAEKSTRKHSPKQRALGQEKLTQEELLEEARITEEWNIADYEAYVRYTELSEKEQTAFLSKRKSSKQSQNSYTLVSRSFVRNNEVISEIVIHPPPIMFEGTKKEKPPVKSVQQLLRIDQEVLVSADKSHKYRHPYTWEGFNSVSEFAEIEEKFKEKERAQVERVIENLKSLMKTE